MSNGVISLCAHDEREFDILKMFEGTGQRKIEGQFIRLGSLKGSLGGHFITFYILERQPRQHFITFWSLEGRLRGHILATGKSPWTALYCI